MQFNALTRLSLLFLLLGDSVARAASIDQIQGEVLVNIGDGYVPVAAPTELKIGDTILANPGSSAVLTCDDGNMILVEPGKVTTVCDTEGMTTIVPGEGVGAVAEGGLGAGGLGSLGASGGLLIGGVAVAAGAAAIAGISSGSDSPVSAQ